MSAATVSRWARRYVLVSALYLVTWQVGMLLNVPRRTTVLLGLFGFVLHMIFGKAYSLVPSYFERDLAASRAPVVQFPLVVAGTSGLVGDSLVIGPPWLGSASAVLWSAGVCVFLATILWTIRTNPTGHETGTGEANADRRPTDRLANGFVPIALLYLLVGTYGTLAAGTGLPLLFDGFVPRVTHLFGAGTAGLLIFALGFRLLPRFLVTSPPRPLVALVLLAGAVGPILLAARLGQFPWFQIGALLEGTAVIGFALGVGLLYVQSERRRVGFYSVLAGAASGVAGVGIGLWFAFEGQSAALVQAHLRLNLLGFVGLTIVGLAYQFYPPGVGSLPGASDRTAIRSIAGLAGGLFVQVAGLVGELSTLTTLGELLTLGGALLYAYLLSSVFAGR